ncbi:Histidinol dehydrogenase homolog 1, partial [Durusdinium trenchii]
ATLTDIESRGDAAVRDLNEKFDGSSPTEFRLSESEIDALMNQVSARDMDDIKSAQEQVRKFAEAQRDSMLDIEVEALPGVIPGHRKTPVQSPGRYLSGGKSPVVASAHMSPLTASVAGVPRIVAATTPFKSEPSPAVIAAMEIGGAYQIYVLGGIQAIGAMALGTEMIKPVDMIV